ncbi:hypothetical protein [Azospirillum doebereinerae]|uniref:Uncharacterized protein n=1 Tax=Azospirillum doebereinerae TaxID=92933 RepID=A0A3S0V2K1_9PROT|nr:hypothetical protein [Azospirillum doebereinerae]RUQ61248.1 hypothetical protein EJ913_30055 [Azospirillum doebereinerae]
MTANPDRILRPMGAASLVIEPDTARDRMFASIVTGDPERCHHMASLPHDVAATLGFEAADQHFTCPTQAILWMDCRAGDLGMRAAPVSPP